MNRTPRRVIEAMCSRHRTIGRWPVSGDYQMLTDSCTGCDEAGRAIQDEHGLRLRLFRDLTPEQVEHQAATHEAAHAVVGVVTGHPLEVIAIAENGGGEGTKEPGGFVTWGPWELPLIDHLAMVWAGQFAGLRWLAEHGQNNEANRIDVLYGAFDDAREADEMVTKCNAPKGLGFTLSARLVDRHWTQIQHVVDELVVARRMDGADVAAMLSGVWPGGHDQDELGQRALSVGGRP
jgi:hypothetical protein